MRSITKGITKGNKHSYDDFGMILASKKIGKPSKEKITKKVPFSNEVYDFSELYGSQTYSERELEYTFNIIASNKVELNIKEMQATEWLMTNSSKEKIYDDDIPGYYFLAECIKIDFEEKYNTGLLKCKFISYPFKISQYEEGNDLWDGFNFELDYAQETKINVSGNKEVEIYNPSVRKITPTIICSSSMSVTNGNTKFLFNSGTTKDWRFTLNIGLNKLEIEGNGEIEFKFRKEVL